MTADQWFQLAMMIGIIIVAMNSVLIRRKLERIEKKLGIKEDDK